MVRRLPRLTRTCAGGYNPVVRTRLPYTLLCLLLGVVELQTAPKTAVA